MKQDKKEENDSGDSQPFFDSLRKSSECSRLYSNEVNLQNYSKVVSQKLLVK